MSHSEESLNDDSRKVPNLLQTEEHLRPSYELSSEYTELKSTPLSSTDSSTKLETVAPSMYDSVVCASLMWEIPTGILQLRPPRVEVSDTVNDTENKVIMDMDKRNILVTSEPSVFKDNPVLPSTGTRTSDFETVNLQNPIEKTDNNTQFESVAPSIYSLVCASLASEIATGSLQLRSPIKHACDSVYENKVIMVKDKPIMSVTSELSVSEDDTAQLSTGPSHFETVILQNTLGGKDNLPKKSFNEECNLNIHAKTRDYQSNSLLMNTDASHTDALHVNLPLACTANLTQKHLVNAVKHHSSMPIIPAISGYQGNAFRISTEQLHKQDYMPSSAAGPSKGTNESFVDMDILNMSSVAGPSGYGINSAVVSNVNESLVTPVPAANRHYKYICQFCEYKANYKSVMESHIIAHTGERPFGCNVCHKFFKRKSAVVRHVQIHRRGKTASLL